MPFYPANEIRVNAQKKRLDVWLIHRCQCCGQTWNFELFARVAPGRLDRTLYDRLLENDGALVRALAFDAQLHARQGAPLRYDGLRYRIEGERSGPAALAEPAEILMDCPVPLGVKLSALLREILGLSAKRFETLLASGALQSPDGTDLARARMGVCCRVLLDPRKTITD